MGIWVRLFGFCLGLFFITSADLFADSPGKPPENAWSRVKGPTQGPAQAIGFYSNGCVAGAQLLPWDGRGYQVMRPSRNRYYGHPVLIRYLESLAATLGAMDVRLLVSDLGQPRGGPMPYGHASHQVGLDADIWFWEHPEQALRSLTIQERDQLPMISMLNENGIVDSRRFGKSQFLKLRVAAESSLVQRIFVNPAIKTYLCSQLDAADRFWLHKLRPWPGHDSHFHVRLYCPTGSKDCVPQAEQSLGDGCEELLPRKRLWDGQGHSLSEVLPGISGEIWGDDHSIESAENEGQRLLERFFVTPTALPPACQSLLKEKVK